MKCKEELLEIIEKDLNYAKWNNIKDGYNSSSIIILNNKLDIIEVATEMALDNEDKVDDWIEAKLITKPTDEQLEHWDDNIKLSFLNISISPYLLVQESNLQ
jgi:hypothetical protein